MICERWSTLPATKLRKPHASAINVGQRWLSQHSSAQIALGQLLTCTTCKQKWCNYANRSCRPQLLHVKGVSTKKLTVPRPRLQTYIAVANTAAHDCPEIDATLFARMFCRLWWEQSLIQLHSKVTSMHWHRVSQSVNVRRLWDHLQTAWRVNTTYKCK